MMERQKAIEAKDYKTYETLIKDYLNIKSLKRSSPPEVDPIQRPRNTNRGLRS